MYISKKFAPTQKTINDFVIRQYESIDWLQKDGVPLQKIGQLYNCSATVYRLGHLLVLKSYNTFVCIFDTTNNEFYDFLRYVYGYTNTSAQHISKFMEFCKYMRINYVDAPKRFTYYHINERWKQCIH